MLEALDIDPVLDDLVRAELVDKIVSGPRPEYEFRHPLIRAVAYESQLKSDRAQLHRRLAQTIEPQDQNAALIAEHLEAAGDLHAAYDVAYARRCVVEQPRHHGGPTELGTGATSRRRPAR